MLSKIWTWVSNLVGNNPKTRYAIFAFIGFFLVLAARCSLAGELHLEAGVAVLHGTGPFLGLNYTFGSTREMHWEAGAQLWGSTTYEHSSVPNNWDPNAMLVVPKGPVSAGIGFAYLQNTDHLDGSHLNFSLKLRYEFTDRLALTVRHLSNAGTVAPNIGRNAIVLDWRLQ